MFVSGLIVYIVDALSSLLTHLRPSTHQAGRFDLGEEQAVAFPAYKGLKCYNIVAGRCWLTLDKQEPIALETGDCFLLTQGTAFCMESAPGSRQVDLVALVQAMRSGLPGLYEGEPACTLGGGHFDFENDTFDLLTRFLPARIVLPRGARSTAVQLTLERMRDELLTEQLGGLFLVQQLAYMMLVDALRGHLSTASPQATGWLYAMSDDKLRPALTAMQDAPMRAWTLDTLAQHVGMSRALFAKRFREKVGETPIEYLTRWRMLRASELLTATDTPVLDVALACGYENVSSFGKAFRRVTGRSPRHHRSKH